MQKREIKDTYVLQTILNRSLDIQTIQSTIFCSDKDIVTSESAVSNGQTRFGLIPIRLCSVFSGKDIVLGLFYMFYDEGKDPTNMTEPDWDCLVDLVSRRVANRYLPCPETRMRKQKYMSDRSYEWGTE